MRKNRALTPTEKQDAREALAILENRGVSLLEAAKFFVSLGGTKTESDSWPINQAIDAFIRVCLARKLRDKSVSFYSENLDFFSARFPGEKMNNVTRDRLQEWLVGMSYPSASARQRAIRALYNHGRKQSPAWCSTNPAEKLALNKPLGDRVIKFLSVEQCRRIMSKALPQHRPALALTLFAGIRPEEVRGASKPALDWGHIDRKARSITIPADIAKNRTMRILQHKLPPVIWKWLPAIKSGPVAPSLSETIQRHAKDAACQNGEEWPHDAMRHTFATYHVAAFGDIAATAELLGHGESLKMLKRHYQGAALKEHGVAFFKLAPA